MSNDALSIVRCARFLAGAGRGCRPNTDILSIKRHRVGFLEAVHPRSPTHSIERDQGKGCSPSGTRRAFLCPIKRTKLCKMQTDAFGANKVPALPKRQFTRWRRLFLGGFHFSIEVPFAFWETTPTRKMPYRMLFFRLTGIWTSFADSRSCLHGWSQLSSI